MSSPLDQFVVKSILPIELAGLDLSFTNSAAAMLIAGILVVCLLLLATQKQALVPGPWQSLVELIYAEVDQVLEDASGSSGRKYMPLIFSTFLFIAVCNIWGMIPMTFTATSHIAVTLALASTIFFIINCIGFIRHGWHYFSILLPAGTPLLLAPLMLCIELFSYLARPFSLSIRLAANMIAGHVVIKILATLAVMFGILGAFPFVLLTIMIGFEIFISLLQAYIFTVLACSYLDDAINLH